MNRRLSHTSLLIHEGCVNREYTEGSARVQVRSELRLKDWKGQRSRKLQRSQQAIGERLRSDGKRSDLESIIDAFTHLHTHKLVDIHKCMPIYIHIHMPIHIHVHVHILINIHTCAIDRKRVGQKDKGNE